MRPIALGDLCCRARVPSLWVLTSAVFDIVHCHDVLTNGFNALRQGTKRYVLAQRRPISIAVAAATAPIRLRPVTVMSNMIMMAITSIEVAMVIGIVFSFFTRRALWKEMRSVSPGRILMI